MSNKLTARQWLDALRDYEGQHSIAFASPQALAEARLIGTLQRGRRRAASARGNGASKIHGRVRSIRSGKRRLGI